MQTTINLNTVDTVGTISNPTSDKSIIVTSFTMKVSNSSGTESGVTIKYSDNTQVNMSTSVTGDRIYSMCDLGSLYDNKDGQDIVFIANENFPNPLQADMVLVINYELI